MRTIIAGPWMSIDGVIDQPGQWSMRSHSDEAQQVIGSLMAKMDSLLLGRKTYQEQASLWAGQSGGMADALNNARKLVVPEAGQHNEHNA